MPTQIKSDTPPPLKTPSHKQIFIIIIHMFIVYTYTLICYIYKYEMNLFPGPQLFF